MEKDFVRVLFSRLTKAVFWIRIRRVRKFLGSPDPYVRGTVPIRIKISIQKTDPDEGVKIIP
jgi:hypothetical protein